ncbi:MAG: efflux RND transporter permease subunit, partial [Chitinophagaceae bacterium]|nr:efflux RND transporter permease subunit [Chitinophagaceae bacterium]
MSVTELAIKRPILFLVFFIVLGAAGIFCYRQLKYELLPELATPFVTIITSYPGSSPSEVETSVTRKIEDGVAEVSRIKKITSNSAEGISVVSIEFIAAANADQAVQEVQRAISKVVPDFPSGVKSPAIEKLNVNDLPVLRMGVTASVQPPELYALLNDLIRPRLAQLLSVGRIAILGGADKELKVFIHHDKLKTYQLSPSDVADAIAKASADFPAGNIKDADRQFSIRVPGKFRDLDKILEQEVRSFADGSSVKVKDVAAVSMGAKETEVINRVDGTASIGLSVSKQSGANAVEVSERVKQEIASLENAYSSIGLKFSIAQDSSEFTLKAAHSVYKDFFIAVILVALVMLAFLHSLRNSLIVMIAIPTSLFSAFILMYAFDYSLNLMTLLAMSLVIGILVDDSIVVLENIYRHLEMGKDKVTASLDGRNEIGFSALSITLVDVVVFLPMALVPGLVGSLVKEFSLVIVVSTLSSLVVSFTLTPMIASRFARLEHPNTSSFFGKIAAWFEKGIQGITNYYGTALQWSLRNKLVTIAAALILLVGSFALVGTGLVGAEFAPATDKGELSLLVNMQPGTTLGQTNFAVTAIEERLKRFPEVTKTFTNVGYQSDGFSESYSPHLAAINISLVSAAERNKSLAELGREMRRVAMSVPGVKARISPIGLFGANDAPVQLIVSGDNRDSTVKLADNVLNAIRGIRGVVDPRLSSELGKPEVSIDVDRDKARELGLDMETIGMAVRTAINGEDQLKFSTPEKEIDMRIQLGGKDRNSTSTLNDYAFTNKNGSLVYLHQFATLRSGSGASVLERQNKQPSVLVLSQVVGRPSGDVGEDIREKLKSMQFPAGTSLAYAGDLELQEDSFGALGFALLSSVILIYLIMVALYNNWTYPFVVLFSIPLAVVGAFLALALTAKSLNIFTIFGLIMMMGLVAKNAILLVDRTNQMREEGASLTDALLDAGRTRLRPILMTTLAMVIGMLPLALAKGAAAELNSGLAWVLIGGLSSSMFLTLLLVPVIYYGINRLLEKLQARKGKGSRQATVSIAVLIISVSAFTPLKAQDDQPPVLSLSLSQAIDAAQKNNSQIKLAELDEWKARYATKEVMADIFPQISANGAYQRNIKPPVFFFPAFNPAPNGGITFDDKNLTPVTAASKNAYNFAVDGRLSVFNPALRSGIKEARLNEQLTHANVQVSRWQLKEEITKAYYNVLVAKEATKLLLKAIDRAAFNLDNSRVIYAKGLVMDADTLNAFVHLENQRPSLTKAINTIEQSMNYLKNLLGLSIYDSIKLSDSLNNEVPDFAAGEDTSAVRRRPDLLFNRLEQEAALQQLKSR